MVDSRTLRAKNHHFGRAKSLARHCECLLAVGGILTVLMVGRALSLKMKPAPVRATAKAKSHSGENMRIWNDGRGTIIDL